MLHEWDQRITLFTLCLWFKLWLSNTFSRKINVRVWVSLPHNNSTYRKLALSSVHRRRSKLLLVRVWNPAGEQRMWSHSSLQIALCAEKWRRCDLPLHRNLQLTPASLHQQPCTAHLWANSCSHFSFCVNWTYTINTSNIIYYKES